MIRALIFDIGGVLASDVWEHLLLDEEGGVTSALNLDAESVRREAQRLWEDFAYRPAEEEDEWKNLEKEYWAVFVERFRLSKPVDFFIDLTESYIRPIPGMLELLERLRSSGLKLGICSNNTEFWFRRQQRALDLYRFFRAENVILSSRVGAPKMSPDFSMFKAAVRSLDVDASDCLLIDDREETVIHGVDFGMAAVIFPSHSERGASYLSALLQKIGVL
jgi:HAD superfamily hydrolase (TIGR01509 family)